MKDIVYTLMGYQEPWLNTINQELWKKWLKIYLLYLREGYYCAKIYINGNLAITIDSEYGDIFIKNEQSKEITSLDVRLDKDDTFCFVPLENILDLEQIIKIIKISKPDCEYHIKKENGIDLLYGELKDYIDLLNIEKYAKEAEIIIEIVNEVIESDAEK